MEESDSDSEEEEDSDDESGFNKKKIHWETTQTQQLLKQGKKESTSTTDANVGQIASALHVPGKRGRKKKSEILEAKKQANQL